MKLVGRFGWLLILMLVSSSYSAAVHAKNLPEGLFLIGLTESGWQFFRVKDDTLTAIDSIEHPRAGTYHPGLNRVAYIGSDNAFVEHDLSTNKETSLLNAGPDQMRYAQPRYSQDGSMLLVVELPDGRSRRTNIIGIDTANSTRYQFVRKRTAQFEPQMMSNDVLFYTTAICVDDCDGMIWELWSRDMHTAKQQQLTLMNAVARQPHLGYDGWMYFSSNANSGHYNIWKMKPSVGSPPEQVTMGTERDSSPATDRDGNLYFLRKSRSETHLMKWANNKLEVMDLPGHILDIRHLEVVQ